MSIKGIGTVLVVWGAMVLTAVLLLGVFPKTMLGAVLLFLVGPVVLIGGELMAEMTMAGFGRIPPIAAVNRWAEKVSADEGVSPIRIGVALMWVILGFAVIAGLSYAFAGTALLDWLDAITPFWNRHFS